jgi:HlyD family secretion protein
MYRPSRVNFVAIPALAVLSLMYAAYATHAMKPVRQSAPPLQSPPQRPFEHTIAAVGLVEPASELIEVGGRVSGWVEKVHVTVGATVAEGDPLFTLDGADLRAELALRQQAVRVAEAELDRLRALPRPEDVPPARAAVQEAQAQLDNARANLGFVTKVDDPRAFSSEERSQRSFAVDTAAARLAQATASLDRLLAGAWAPELAIATQRTEEARASAERTRADLDRLTVRSPISGMIYKVNAKAGEYTAAGASRRPPLLLGSPPPLHVRVDINEEDAVRVVPSAAAVASIRGDATRQLRLEFVRMEPVLIPKQALSGSASERVDTRVMQAIYHVLPGNGEPLVGQQMDIYIQARPTDRADSPA